MLIPIKCSRNSLTNILDLFSNNYDNFIVMGSFNMQLVDTFFKSFMDIDGFINLIKNKTFFKCQGSCVYLILTNRKHSFQNSGSYETAVSDHCHIIYTKFKSTFSKAKHKTIRI